MPWLCQPFKDQGLVRESSEAEQAFGNPGTAMATVRRTEPLPWLWTVYSVPCLCPAREGAGLPQPGSLLTWHRVYLSYSVGSFIASWKLCHLSLGIIVCAPPKGWIVATDGWQIFLSAPVWTYFHAGQVTVKVMVPFLHISLFHASVPCFSRLIEKGAQREESPSNSSWLCWEPLLRDSLWESPVWSSQLSCEIDVFMILVCSWGLCELKTHNCFPSVGQGSQFVGVISRARSLSVFIDPTCSRSWLTVVCNHICLGYFCSTKDLKIVHIENHGNST